MSTKAFGGMAGHQSQSCSFYFLYSSCSALTFRSCALSFQPREFTLRILFCTHDVTKVKAGNTGLQVEADWLCIQLEGLRTTGQRY